MTDTLIRVTDTLIHAGACLARDSEFDLSFKEVTGRYNGPALEKEVLEFWREHDVFAKTVEATKDGPQFSFNEGPPTANGKPGIHHVLARSFKDIFPRYKTMRGYYVPRKAGWDTHGPVSYTHLRAHETYITISYGGVVV